MNPPSGVNPVVCPDSWLSPSESDPPASSAAVAASLQAEQFIWSDIEPTAGAVAATAPANDNTADAAIAQIVVVSGLEDDACASEEGPQEDWRRQLLSALHDVDREVPSPPPLPEPETAAPIPYVEPPPRMPPRSLAPQRQPRIVAAAPVARAPRHRLGVSLLGLSAAAALLAGVLPRATNMPEATATTAGASLLLAAGSPQPAARDSAARAPVMINAPVLIRESAAPSRTSAPMPLPMIEMVRTVPVQLGHDAHPTPAAASSAIATSAEPQTAEPHPAAAPPDREQHAALTSQAASPEASVPPLPEAKSSIPAPAAAAPAASTSTPRTPRKRSSSDKRTKSVKQRTARTATRNLKTAARTRRPAWDERRQGLSTTPPEEPSGLQKLTSWLWPFSKSNTSGAAPADRQQTPSTTPTSTAKDEPVYRWGDQRHSMP